jgi:hypothetical protein
VSRKAEAGAAVTAGVLILPKNISSPPAPINLILALCLEYNNESWGPGFRPAWLAGSLAPQGCTASADPILRGWGGGRLNQKLVQSLFSRHPEQREGSNSLKMREAARGSE